MGAVQRSYNLLKRVAVKHQVSLVAFNQKALLGSAVALADARNEMEKMCTHVDILPIPSDRSKAARYGLVLRSLFSADPYTINWLKDPAMCAIVKEVVERVKPDLVHVDTISLVPYFDALAQIPRVLNHHNIESVMMKRRAAKESHFLKRAYFGLEGSKIEAAEKRFCAEAKVNLAVSRVDAEDLRKICPSAVVEICENGCDTTYFTPNLDIVPEPGHLLFVGNLKWYPNHDAVMYFCREVWPALTRGCPSVKFTVVGAHPSPEILRFAKADERIRVTGLVDDVRPFFHRAEVFVCPIWDGGGTRLKLLDAMAMGKPIVTTTIGCEGLDVVPNQNVLIADTSADFVRQITAVTASRQLRQRLGESARRLAEAKYSWDSIAGRLMEMYQKVSC